MGFPIVCSCCNRQNGLVVDKCVYCGHILPRPGSSPTQVNSGGFPPSAHWETDVIHDIWRQAPVILSKPENINIHEFLRYCLLLDAVRREFEHDDAAYWFDDCLFFLRGGYDFFCHLNMSSNLSLRGRIFGGLNHAKRPEQRLKEWFRRIVTKADACGATKLDIFALDEINSGTSINRFLKILQKSAEDMAPYRILPTPLEIVFHHYLCRTEYARYSVHEIRSSLIKNRRRCFSINHIHVINHFKIFTGPMLSYDSEIYSGLKKISQGRDSVEAYTCLKYAALLINLNCPTTQQAIHRFAPGTNDIPRFLGWFILEILAHNKSPGVTATNFMQSIRYTGCPTCQRLLSQVRGQGGRPSAILT